MNRTDLLQVANGAPAGDAGRLSLVFPGNQSFSREECTRTCVVEPAAGFVDYEFLIPAEADLQTTAIELPPLPGVMRLKSIDVFSRTNPAFPYWRCCADTGFRGMVEPQAGDRMLLDGAVLLMPSGNQRSVIFNPDVLPEETRTLRISLACDLEISPSFEQALIRHFRRGAAETFRRELGREAESRELLDCMRQKDRQLAQCMAERDRQIAERDGAVLERDRLIGQREYELHVLRIEMDALRKAIAHHETVLDQTFRSRSWRLTAPLRGFTRLIALR